MHQVHKTRGHALLSVPGQRRDAWSELDAQHHAQSSHCFDDAGILLRELPQAGLELLAHAPGILAEIFALDHLQDLQCHRASEWRTAVSAAVAAGIQNIRIRTPDPERSYRKTAAERLCHRDRVGEEPVQIGLKNSLEALEAA